jgi:hypothetical protein
MESSSVSIAGDLSISTNTIIRNSTIQFDRDLSIGSNQFLDHGIVDSKVSQNYHPVSLEPQPINLKWNSNIHLSRILSSESELIDLLENKTAQGIQISAKIIGKTSSSTEEWSNPVRRRGNCGYIISMEFPDMANDCHDYDVQLSMILNQSAKAIDKPSFYVVRNGQIFRAGKEKYAKTTVCYRSEGGTLGSALYPLIGEVLQNNHLAFFTSDGGNTGCNSYIVEYPIVTAQDTSTRSQ